MPYKLHIAIAIILAGVISGCGTPPKILTELEVVVCPPKIPDMECPFKDLPPEPKAGDLLPETINKYHNLNHRLFQCKEAIELRDRAWKRCKRLSKKKK